MIAASVINSVLMFSRKRRSPVSESQLVPDFLGERRQAATTKTPEQLQAEKEAFKKKLKMIRPDQVKIAKKSK